MTSLSHVALSFIPSEDLRDHRVAYHASAIGTLPIELIVAIFGYTCPHIRSRIKLTHICRRLREMTLNEASLWTYVEIPPIDESSKMEMDHLLFLLEMQVSRTATSPLDVVFFLPHYYCLYDDIINIYRKYDSLSRWHTLVLHLDCIEMPTRLEHATFFTSDAFPNMNLLTVVYQWSYHRNAIDVIRQRTFSRCVGGSQNPPSLTLMTIDVDFKAKATRQMIQDDLGGVPFIHQIYGGRLFLLESLVLPKATFSEFEDPPSIDLPINVIKIVANIQHFHPFPHVKSYKLDSCIFTAVESIKLGSLVHLNITTELRVESGCHLVLPQLISFSCGALELQEDASLTAPLLYQLRLHWVVDGIRADWFKLVSQGAALCHAGFGLLPSHTLLLEHEMSPKIILYFLRRLNRVRKMTLTFWDETDAKRVLDALLDDADQDPLCPDVCQLTIRFRQTPALTGFWKAIAVRLVETRQASAVNLRLNVAWEVDGIYVDPVEIPIK